MPQVRAIRSRLQLPGIAVLGGILLLGAILRFATLDLQSYRYDEAVTVGRVLHANFFDTFATIPHSESTPPLYYLVAWAWSKPFGTGEAWMRSLSALAGTASIAVVYLGARALPLPRRAGLIAAAVVAVSPVMIWFSQDVRAYALLTLLAALSFLFFARARRSGAGRDLAWWGAFSALALTTHYFAGFLIAPEAVLLLLGRNRRGAVLATMAIVATGALLTPIALEQSERNHAGWIGRQPLGERLERSGAKLLGSDTGDEHGVRPGDGVPLEVPAALAVLAVALLLWRGDSDERRSTGLAALVGGSAVALSLLLAVLGKDYLDGRNLLAVFIPLAIGIGAGFGVRRAGAAGLVAAGAFCLCSLVFSLQIDRLPRLQREDLRNAAAVVGGLGPGKVVVTDRYTANQPLRYYLGAEFATSTPPPIREIDLVGSATAGRHAAHLLPSAFHLVGSRPVSYEFTLTRYRASHAVRVPLRRLENGALVAGGGRASVLVAPRTRSPAS